jgi:hypothetical protein
VFKKIFFGLTLLLIVYGPWHDSYFLGVRKSVGISFSVLSKMTWSGFANLIWIILASLVLATLSSAQLKEVIKNRWNWFGLAWIVFSVAHISALDQPTLTILENYGMLFLLIIGVTLPQSKTLKNWNVDIL